MSWEWVEPYVGNGFSLLAVRGVAPEGALDVIGVDQSDAMLLTWDQALVEFPGTGEMVRWGCHQNWHWFFQPVGGDMIEADTVRSLSAGGAAFAVAARGAGSFFAAYAEDNETVAHWETEQTPIIQGQAAERLFPGASAAPGDPSPASKSRPSFGVREALQAAGDRSGLQVTQSDILGPLMTGEISSPLTNWLNESNG